MAMSRLSNNCCLNTLLVLVCFTLALPFTLGQAFQFKAVLLTNPADATAKQCQATVQQLAASKPFQLFTVNTPQELSPYITGKSVQVVILCGVKGTTFSASLVTALQTYVQNNGGFVSIGTGCSLPELKTLTSATCSASTPSQRSFGVLFTDGASAATKDLATKGVTNFFGTVPLFNTNPRCQVIESPCSKGPKPEKLPGTTGTDPTVVDCPPATLSQPADTCVNVLAQIALSTDLKDASGKSYPYKDWPISWCHDLGNGRTYTVGLGTTDAQLQDPNIQYHINGAILAAAGVVPGDCTAGIATNVRTTSINQRAAAPAASGFDKINLNIAQLNEPMQLTVVPDGRIFWVQRGGKVRCRQASGAVFDVLNLNVNTGIEDGLLGITHDPKFATNGYMYMFLSPNDAATGVLPNFNAANFCGPGTGGTSAIKCGINRVVRYTVPARGSGTSSCAMTAPVAILDIRTQRSECCHSGGWLGFDKGGNLLISIGDNTNPFQANNGYTPIDQRAGRNAFDAQKSSSNTNDLRGSILRILPVGAATQKYTIPAGNFCDFYKITSACRREIYIKGNRNPFRAAVDRRGTSGTTGWLYWGEVGPDATDPSAAFGPVGMDEFNLAQNQPGFYGWPYCIGNNQAYVNINSGSNPKPKFNCAGAVNTSPNNGGIRTALPPAKPAIMWYDYLCRIRDFPQWGCYANLQGRAAMAGAIWRQESTHSANALPAYYEGTLFAMDWSRNCVLEVPVTAPVNGRATIRSTSCATGFLPGTWKGPISMDMGYDGRLYVLEWGSGYSGTSGTGMYIIQYRNGQPSPPVAVINTNGNIYSGKVPLTITFDGRASKDTNAGTLSWSWNWGDGTAVQSGSVFSHTFTKAGVFTVTLTVRNAATAKTATSTMQIVAGNTAPRVTITAPASGEFWAFNTAIPYAATITDAEDGTFTSGSAACNTGIAGLTVLPGLGHDSHVHAVGPPFPTNKCSGTFAVGTAQHAPGSNIFSVLNVDYLDKGPVQRLTAHADVKLNPTTREAEFFTRASAGLRVESNAAKTATWVGYIKNGAWIAYNPVNFKGVKGIKVRLAAPTWPAVIEFRNGSPTGTLLASVTTAVTGGWQTFQTQPANPVPISSTGTMTLYVVFKESPSKPAKGDYLVNFDQFLVNK